MESRSKKIFWGIIIASLHVKWSGVLLFPVCFGFAILYFGLHDLEREGGAGIEEGVRKRMHIAAAALVFTTAIFDFLSFVPLFSPDSIWKLAPFMLEYSVLFYVMDLYCGIHSRTEGLRRAYALVMGTALCGYGLSLIFFFDMWRLFFGIIMLLCRALVLKAAFCAGNSA